MKFSVASYHNDTQSGVALHSVVRDECFVFAYASGKGAEQAVREITETMEAAYLVLRHKHTYIETRSYLLLHQIKNAQRMVDKVHFTGKWGVGSMCFSERKWWAGSLGEARLMIPIEEQWLVKLPAPPPLSKRLIEDSRGLPITYAEGMFPHTLYFIWETLTLAQTLNASQHQTILKQPGGQEVKAKALVELAHKRRKVFYGVALGEVRKS